MKPPDILWIFKIQYDRPFKKPQPLSCILTQYHSLHRNPSKIFRQTLVKDIRHEYDLIKKLLPRLSTQKYLGVLKILNTGTI